MCHYSLPVLLTSLRKTRGTSPLLHGSYTPQYDPPRSSTNSPQSSSTSESPEDFLESWLSGRSPSGKDRKRTSAVTTFAQTFDVCKATNGMPPSPLRTRHSLGPQCSRSDRTWSTCTFDTASSVMYNRLVVATVARDGCRDGCTHDTIKRWCSGAQVHYHSRHGDTIHVHVQYIQRRCQS